MLSLFLMHVRMVFSAISCLLLNLFLDAYNFDLLYIYLFIKFILFDYLYLFKCRNKFNVKADFDLRKLFSSIYDLLFYLLLFFVFIILFILMFTKMLNCCNCMPGKKEKKNSLVCVCVYVCTVR